MRKCRDCGCSELQPCVDLIYGHTCSWVGADLCSFCAANALRSLTIEQIEEMQLAEQARFAHELAQQLPVYSAAEHLEAARLYAEACQR